MYGVLAAFLEKDRPWKDDWQVQSRGGVRKPGRLPTDWAPLHSWPQGDTMGHAAGVLPQCIGLLQKVQGRESRGFVHPAILCLLFPISFSLPCRDQSLAFLDGVLALVDSPSQIPWPWCVSLSKAKVHEQKQEATLEIWRRTCRSCPTIDGYFLLGPTGLLHLYLPRIQNLLRSKGVFTAFSLGGLCFLPRNSSKFMPPGGFSMGLEVVLISETLFQTLSTSGPGTTSYPPFPHCTLWNRVCTPCKLVE